MTGTWARIIQIVMPIVGEALKQLALWAWEMVEKWAESLSVQGKKPTSVAKAEQFGKTIKLYEPNISQPQLDLVRETAHDQKTRRSGKDGRKPT